MSVVPESGARLPQSDRQWYDPVVTDPYDAHDVDAPELFMDDEDDDQPNADVDDMPVGLLAQIAIVQPRPGTW